MMAAKHALYKGDTINRLEKTGARQGEWTYFAGDSLLGYRSAERLLEGSFLNNQKVGSWLKHHPGGEASCKLLFAAVDCTGHRFLGPTSLECSAATRYQCGPA